MPQSAPSLNARIARTRWSLAAALVAALLVTLLTPDASMAQNRLDRREYKSGPAMRRVFRPAIAKVGQSTVRIKCAGEDAALGLIVDAQGLIITKASEVTDEITCHLADGRSFDAKLVARYVRDDVAMLKIDATELPVAQWSAEPVDIGQWAVTAGVGEDPVAVGIVSVMERRVPEPAVLGIMLDRTDSAARVRRVFPDSGAAKAGLQSDDVITQIADRPVKNGDELVELIQEFRPGDTVRLNLLRGEEVVELEVELSPRPSRPGDRSQFQNQLGGELSERNFGFERAFQHDTVLKPSDCGGPLVNLDGQIVGLNIARSGRTESYALPAPLVQRIITEFKAGQHAVAPTPQPPVELTSNQEAPAPM